MWRDIQEYQIFKEDNIRIRAKMNKENLALVKGMIQGTQKKWKYNSSWLCKIWEDIEYIKLKKKRWY